MAQEMAESVQTVTIPRQHTRASSLPWQPAAPRRDSSALAYLAVMCLGAVLFVIAALQQPYTYDELTQIAPYGSGDPGEITSATRQPPLAPLLEAGIQRLLGEGQLQQRLLPVLSGIGGLAAMALLLRRLGLGYAGALALLLMASSPLTVRYSAYTRPYAEALCLMLLLALATHAWLQGGRRGWLVTAALAAVAMPLVRVPEPTVFLLVTAATLVLLSLRRRLPWRRTLPVVGICTAALACVGLVQAVVLADKADGVADVSPGGMLSRVEPGLRELWSGFLPTLADAFSPWPLALALLGAALLVPSARRRLLAWPAFWPLLAAPVAFAVAYHLAFRISFDALPYRARFASFFVPVLVLAAAALLSAASERRERLPALLGAALVGALLLSQLPRTLAVLTRDAAPDFAALARVLQREVPPSATVLYDRPAPPGASRQPYLGKARYLGSTPPVVNVRDLLEKPATGPTYLLFNGTCAYEGRCVPGRRHRVDVPIPGFRLVHADSRFTLYAPMDGQGVLEALEASGEALGPELGYVQAHVRAGLLAEAGRVDEARRVLDDLGLSTQEQERAAYTLRLYGLDQALP